MFLTWTPHDLIGPEVGIDWLEIHKRVKYSGVDPRSDVPFQVCPSEKKTVEKISLQWKARVFAGVSAAVSFHCRLVTTGLRTMRFRSPLPAHKLQVLLSRDVFKWQINLTFTRIIFCNVRLTRCPLTREGWGLILMLALLFDAASILDIAFSRTSVPKC